MRSYNIKNLDDLQAKKQALKLEYTFREESLKADFNQYTKQFTIGGFIKKLTGSNNLSKVDHHLNLSGSLMSLILPIFMNKTLFRGSGFITKSLVALVSSKLGKKIDLDNLSSIFSSMKGWVSNLGSKKKVDPYVDYGIPADSETF